MIRVKILEKYCKSCGLCIAVCPKKGLCLAGKLNDLGVHPAEHEDDIECTGCCQCALVCPDAAIVIEREVTDKDKKEE